ncbi:hypothetical protein GCM10023149_25140 [Mucilaginibacter gynuensis]|uniref:Acyl-CoA thioester hydrolase n=2 Tax=Mucilaginibacter gynuensis TaxID=1302236 RepID=A0ABP8GGH0_9SPHI
MTEINGLPAASGGLTASTFHVPVFGYFLRQADAYFCVSFKIMTMEYSKSYIVKDEHIDVQGIMDGLYYPFYMEWCRHDFIRDVLGFDFETEAKNGVYMVLSSYSLHFLRSLKKGDEFTVTCSVYRDRIGMPKLHFKQAILLNNKAMAKAVFSGTCVPASGGRPYLPESVLVRLQDFSVLED